MADKPPIFGKYEPVVPLKCECYIVYSGLYCVVLVSEEPIKIDIEYNGPFLDDLGIVLPQNLKKGFYKVTVTARQFVNIDGCVEEIEYKDPKFVPVTPQKIAEVLEIAIGC